jgi:hypothetical protein
MKSQIDPKVAALAIVLIVAVAGFAFWKFAFAKKGITDEKGIPLVPTEAKAGADAMSQLYKTGIKPPATR